MAIREASPLGQHPTLPAGGEGLAPSSIRANSLPEPPKPRLLDRVRQALRARHICCRRSQHLLCYADQPIPWSNCSYPVNENLSELNPGCNQI
jgi:hypothetical protein